MFSYFSEISRKISLPKLILTYFLFQKFKFVNPTDISNIEKKSSYKKEKQ